MAFAKQGIVTITTIKCSCGSTLDNVAVTCSKCGKNLRPLSNPPPEKATKKDKKPA